MAPSVQGTYGIRPRKPRYYSHRHTYLIHQAIAQYDEVITTLRGQMVELMVKTAPKIYMKYITLDTNNKHVLYMKLQKTLCGCLVSAILLYLKLVLDLELKDFNINPYDSCITNKMIEGNRFTVTWHVNDLKLSHVEESEITKKVEWMESIQGKIRV
jgi:hypothetical protein